MVRAFRKHDNRSYNVAMFRKLRANILERKGTKLQLSGMGFITMTNPIKKTGEEAKLLAKTVVHASEGMAGSPDRAVHKSIPGHDDDKPEDVNAHHTVY